jgi:hypothetical protein
MTLTPRGEAFLAASRLASDYELGDLSPQEINKLDMASYAKIRKRAGLDPIDPFEVAYAPEVPGRPRQEAPAPDQDPVTEFQNMSMAEYEQLRNRLGIGRSPADRGLFE